MECGKPEAAQDNEGNDIPANTKSTSISCSKSKGKGSSLAIKNKNMLKIFCERHRPFKLIKEINEKYDTATEEVKKF